MRGKVGSADRAIAKIAGRQRGVVAISQLLDAGVSRDAVERRARRGLLHRVHRGVYRVTYGALSTEASYMAAVLACGDGAALTGMAAAFEYALVRGAAPPPEVTAPTNRRVEGVITHRADLNRRDTSRYKGIPITTVPRTLVDIAGNFELDPLSALCHQAQIRFRVRAFHVEAALERRPNAAGAGTLKAIFRGDAQIVLSRLERAFLELLREAGLPLPITNLPAGGRYVDCRWPERALTVELDSYTYHHTRHAWRQDHLREREARARDEKFRRYVWDDLRDDPAGVVSELRPLLTRPARPSP